MPTFKYNAQQQPQQIDMPGVGSVNFQYNRQGEVRSVSSPQGMRTALQITGAFQSIGQLIKP